MDGRAMTIAVANEKGGVGKTTSTWNLSVALRRRGLRVLMVDLDPQANLTFACGASDLLARDGRGYPLTVGTLLTGAIKDAVIDARDVIVEDREGVDLLPADLQLCQVEMLMMGVPVARERLLDRVLEPLRGDYDAILLDCMPSLGMLTVNDLCAADGVLIPTGAAPMDVQGLDLLLGTIGQAHAVNPRLRVLGALFTQREARRNVQDMVEDTLRRTEIHVFDTTIPRSTKVVEASGMGASMFAYEPAGRVAGAYEMFAGELMACAGLSDAPAAVRTPAA